MLGELQITETIEINQTAEAVFAIIDNTSHLENWAPAVQKVVEWSATGEQIGAVRRCEAALGGKTGTMVEKVIAREEGRSLTYGVIEESFGMTKILKNYGFKLSLQPEGAKKTTAKIETFYTPANIFARVLNRIMMKRQFRKVVRQLLQGLKEYTEK